MTEAFDPLAVVAGKINAFLDKAAKADDYRISAGQLLIEARTRVEKGEAGLVTWTGWCGENVKRSSRDIRRVMQLAGAPDPAAAYEAETASRRVGAREAEQTQCPVPHALNGPISREAVQEAIKAFSPGDLAAFKEWFRGYTTAPLPRTAAQPAREAVLSPECSAPSGCHYGGCGPLGKCLHRPTDSTVPMRPAGRAQLGEVA